MKSYKFFVLLFLLSAFFTGCEKQEYFKSESGIRNQLRHKWHRVQISHTEDSPIEFWDFHDNKLTITGSNNASASIEGEFSVRTTLTRVFITTKNFQNGPQSYNNAKWTVISLDSEILVIAADDPVNGSLIEREFTRE